MFVRGSGLGREYSREEHRFLRGIVVKNNDPLRLNRVKVYIPTISNQPFEEWLEKYDEINLRFQGKNNKTDTWVDTKIFEKIAENIPWAEPCYSLMGEGGNARYVAGKESVTSSDCNYEEGFQTNDKEPITITTGSFSPAYLYENSSTVLGDAFNQPLTNFSVKCNPYSFNYRSSKHVNKGKGMFGIPEVGSKVWVFHDDGDLNFPVYFGRYTDYRTLTLVNDTDNTEKISPKYPSDFEN
jgi:hypothetical protein